MFADIISLDNVNLVTNVVSDITTKHAQTKIVIQLNATKDIPKYANIKETMKDVNLRNIAGLIMTSKMMCLKIVKKQLALKTKSAKWKKE